MGTSVIFTAYKQMGAILQNIRAILENRKDVECIIVADEVPKEECDEVRAALQDVQHEVICNEKRIGKVNALNTAIKRAKGSTVLILDNDVEITSGDPIGAVEDTLKRGDFGQGIIVASGNSFLQSGARMDYLGINATIAVQEQCGVGFGVNGACIIAKKEVLEQTGGFRHVITEDSDFGTRASEAGFHPVLARSLRVRTEPPRRYGEWFRQRVRWAVGEMQAVLKNKNYHKKYPLESVAQGITVVPFIVPLLIQIIAPGNTLAKGIYLLASALSAINPVMPVIATVAYLLLELSNPLVAAMNVGLIAIWATFWKRVLEYPVKTRDVVIYGTVYGPLWVSVLIGAAAYVTTRGDNIKEFRGWKV